MDNSQLHWLTPEWFILLPLLWGYLWWQSKKQHENNVPTLALAENKTSTFYHPLAELFAEDESQKSAKKRFKLLSGIIISALIIALAQPILRGKKLPDPPPERDIVFLVDTSISMQLKDYQIDGVAISRMDLLRQLLDKFASRMKGERISVIIFAEQAYKLVPLSNDQNLIRKMLQRITTSLAGRYSDIGSALLLALQEAKKQDLQLENQSAKKRHQTFILFSDADESRGKVDVHGATALLAENDIPLFTIAIGGSTSSQKETEGGLYHSVNMPLFDALAEQTKGKSYRVENSDTFEKAISDISKLRKNLALQEPKYIQTSLYFYPLFFGLLLLFLRQLLTLVGNKR
ncbi:MAG: VWA domain-containing protein [Cocleimonas sp.]